jgi:hypothetical protein
MYSSGLAPPSSQGIVQDVLKTRRLDGFEQRNRTGGQRCLDTVTFPGQEQHREPWADFGRLSGQLDTRDAGHDHVGYERVDGVAGAKVAKRLVGIICANHDVTHGFQKLLKNAPIVGVIVDAKDAHGAWPGRVVYRNSSGAIHMCVRDVGK